ncbi:MAG: hypothetical protein PHH58_16645 [Rhodoferax sp.]|nr:hypothetical protein [Rhodoferax sp.]
MQDDPTARLAASMETLNARIARLAIGLGIDLDREETLTKLLAQPVAAPVPVERRRTSGGAATVPMLTTERRVTYLKEELRALVVLRYRLESSSLECNGLAITRELMEQAHQHLLERGFKPGADGWHEQDWKLR